MFERYGVAFLFILGAWLVFIVFSIGTAVTDLSGRVIDADGQRVTNAEVTVEPINIMLTSDTLSVSDDGTFHYQEIGKTNPRGTWEVRITCIADGYKHFTRVFEVEGSDEELVIVLKPVEPD